MSDAAKKGGNVIGISNPWYTFTKEQKEEYQKWGLGPDFFENFSVQDPQKKQQANIYTSFEEASKAVDDAVTALADKQIDNPVLVKTTPGIGKTEAGIHLVTRWSKKGIRGFYAMPTRDMGWQVFERIKAGVYGAGHRVVNLEGRHDGYIRSRVNEKSKTIDEIEIKKNCYNYEWVQKAATKGYPPGGYVCPSCPHFPFRKDQNGNMIGFGGACVYYKAFFRAAGITLKNDEYNWAPIVVSTHQMLATIVTVSKAIKPEAVIIDEDWASALRETTSWSENELLRKIEHAEELAVFRKLLAESIKLAKKYKHQADYPFGPEADQDKTPDGVLLRNSMKESKVFDSYAIWGKRLSYYIKIAAKNIGLDFQKVLESAVVADDGVSPGEYMGITPMRDAVTPHHKEPELAEALLTVIGQEIEGKETAYKVSLRFDAQNGWGYYLDNVRRMGFGGPSVFLDAYGSEKLVSSVCNGRDIDVIDVHCVVRANTHIYHHTDVRTSRSNMEVNRDQIFDDYVDIYLRKHRHEKALFYINKRNAKWLKKRIIDGHYELESGVIKWFWQDRGDDSYGDYDIVVVLGTPYSHVVEERHFANAMFYGEEPLDWSMDENFNYKDERVRLHMESRQQNEMKQALYRLREAKPREKEQTIVVVSAMKIDYQYEMPGATVHYQKKGPPDHDGEEVWRSIETIMKMTGGWTDLFSAFIHREHELKEWLDAGGIESKIPFIYTYKQLMAKFLKWRKDPCHRSAKGILAHGMMLPFKNVQYRGKDIKLCGDEEKVIAFLELIRTATREPGIDDDVMEKPEKAANILLQDELPAPVVNKVVSIPDPADDIPDPDELMLKAMDIAANELWANDPTGQKFDSPEFIQRCKEVYEQLKTAADEAEIQQELAEFNEIFGHKVDFSIEESPFDDEDDDDDPVPPPDDS